MFKWVNLKIIALIAISSISINLSNCDKPTNEELKQECDKWNKFCKSARSGFNKNFRCYSGSGSGVIYFYEPEQRGWDEARQLCSLKFDGSYFADLVQLPDSRKEDVEKMLGDLDIKKEIELATSGVCCMKKQSNNRWANECGWLSSLDNEKHSELFNGHNSDKCTILTIIYDGKQINGSRLIGKSSDPTLPYLCGFNLPDKCVLENANTTRGPFTTDSPSTVDNSNLNLTTKIILMTTKSVRYSTEPSPNIENDLYKIYYQINQAINSTILLDISDQLKNLLKSNEKLTKNSVNITMKIVNQMREKSKILDEYQGKRFADNIIEILNRIIMLLLNMS